MRAYLHKINNATAKHIRKFIANINYIRIFLISQQIFPCSEFLGYTDKILHGGDDLKLVKYKLFNCYTNRNVYNFSRYIKSNKINALSSLTTYIHIHTHIYTYTHLSSQTQ